jgi:hypothetical protein
MIRSFAIECIVFDHCIKDIPIETLKIGDPVQNPSSYGHIIDIDRENGRLKFSWHSEFHPKDKLTLVWLGHEPRKWYD